MYNQITGGIPDVNLDIPSASPALGECLSRRVEPWLPSQVRSGGWPGDETVGEGQDERNLKMMVSKRNLLFQGLISGEPC